MLWNSLPRNTVDAKTINIWQIGPSGAINTPDATSSSGSPKISESQRLGGYTGEGSFYYCSASHNLSLKSHLVALARRRTLDYKSCKSADIWACFTYA